MDKTISETVTTFVHSLTLIIERAAAERTRAAIEIALMARPKRGPGRPLMLSKIYEEPVRARRKGPPQLCPVPGCKNKAAPVFGMVCKDHKDVAKSKIQKYREARKAQKAAA